MTMPVYEKPKSDFEYLVQSLKLAMWAPTTEQSQRAIAEALWISERVHPEDISLAKERAKKEFIREVEDSDYA